MAGPVPKAAALRQRRNKASTAANLKLAPSPDAGADTPELPKRGTRKWHPLVIEWWRRVWASPMAAEFLESDIEGLYLIAELRQRFWGSGKMNLATEIRLQEQRFGLSPIDRRRLQWEVAKAEEAEAKRQPLRPDPTVDPRELLRVLS